MSDNISTFLAHVTTPLVSPGVPLFEETVVPPSFGTLQPYSTCPKTPHEPYVIFVHGAPAIATFIDEGYNAQSWNLWLGGRPTGATIPEKGISGWFPIVIPD
jgi:hypothetical protein